MRTQQFLLKLTLLVVAATALSHASQQSIQASPQSIVDAAHAAKQTQQSAPPTKVIRNKDLADPNDLDKPDKSQTPATPAPTQASPDAALLADRKFEAQGKIFQNQIRVQKGKLVDIQNHIQRVKYEFATWSAEFSQDYDAPACWTSQYNTPYYKEWCDTGRNLKAEYDAAQNQLTQEKANLDKMQENIRHQGYGNAVYDPD